ncbi:alpha/beta hydrolase [bacterium]|nr:alpha/beta hydrolase [bacterium]
MIDEQLRIATDSGKQVIGRVTGNEASDTVLIFSHGFGVKSDSRGMFNQIVTHFQTRDLTVRFHYVITDDITQDTFATNYSEQVEKLHTVIERVQKKYGKKKIVIISHSRGCGITCRYIVEQKILPRLHIMLAPPTTVENSTRTREKFKKREGAVLNRTGISIYPRSDGTKTFIPSNYWDEAESMNPLEVYAQATTLVPTTIIWGTLDTTVGQDKLPELEKLGVKRLVKLPNSHDFTEDNVVGVIKILDEELE